MTPNGVCRTVFRKIIEVPSYLGSQFIRLPPVAKRLDAAYSRQKSSHRPNLPSLCPLDTAIVRDLRDKGVHITSLASLQLPNTAELVAAAGNLMQKYDAMRRDGTISGSFQSRAKDVLESRQIFLWGLDERLLSIVEQYLELPVAYDGINIYYTIADGRQVAGRRWHRDTEDRHMLKVAVYFNDVGDDGGPLQILHRDLPNNRPGWNGLFPVHTDQSLVRALKEPIRQSDVTTCVGPAGTVIFADTARHYHRGKPATSGDRFAVFFNYFSRRPLRPFRCERSTLSRAHIRELATGLPRRKQDCLLWRDSLPLLARIVPPAPPS